jgi:hypothetical protein
MQHDEVLARAAPLVGMVHAGVNECLLHPVAVDRGGGLVGVLLDDREQIAEESALLIGQLGALDGSVRLRIRHAVDRRSRREQRRRPRLLGPITVRPVLLPGPGQPPGRWFVLVRNRRPSSYRWA